MDTHEGDELTVLWFKVESAMATHPKTRRIPRDGIVAPTRTAAMGVWWFAASWTAQTETDGFVPGEEFERWDPTGELTKYLVTAGYLEAVVVNDEPGYVLHDWLDVQQSKEQLTASRTYDARKSALHRDAELTAAVRARDADRCRYCGTLVNWSDRRSPVGATYDHVDPAQGNTEDNVVVCCRGCNAKKAGRTPDVAGMPLLPPRSTGRPTGASSDLDRNQIGTRPELVLISPIEEELELEKKKKTRARGARAAAPRTARATAGPEFEEWYAAYPRHVAPEAAARAFVKARRSVTHSELMTATRRFATTTRDTEKRFVPHPATWLNAGRWADEPDRRRASGLNDY